MEVEGFFLKGLFEAAADEFAEFEYAAVGDVVVDHQAFFTAGDQAGFGQGVEVAGDIGLIAFGGIHQCAHVLFTVKQRVQQSESHRLAHDGKASGNQLQGFIGKRT